MKLNLANLRKALVAVAGLVGQVAALGLLHGSAQHIVQVVLGALAAVGVYAVPNTSKPAPATPAAPAAPVAPPK